VTADGKGRNQKQPEKGFHHEGLRLETTETLVRFVIFMVRHRVVDGVKEMRQNYWRSSMPRIPYADPEAVSDPEIRGYLERARKEGTPRPESQAIRAHNPNVIRAFSQAWELTFRNGVVDHALKELCRVYVSKSIDCEY